MHGASIAMISDRVRSEKVVDFMPVYIVGAWWPYLVRVQLKRWIWYNLSKMVLTLGHFRYSKCELHACMFTMEQMYIYHIYLNIYTIVHFIVTSTFYQVLQVFKFRGNKGFA